MDLPVTLCPIDRASHVEGIPGRTVDISVGGACVETLRPVEGEGDPMVILRLISASIMVLQDHAFYPRPPTDSGEDQRLVMRPQPLDQGHELAVEGQLAAVIGGCGRGGAVSEPSGTAGPPGPGW